MSFSGIKKHQDISLNNIDEKTIRVDLSLSDIAVCENKEKIYLTVIRLVLWRIIATITSILVSFIFTNDISKALKIGGIDNFIKMIIQFFYERIWIYYLNGKEENKRLTIIRIIIWRIIGICLTMLISYIITDGNINKSIDITLVDHSTKIIIHYIYERIWIFLKRK